jgi:hypothetical protein
MLPVTLSRMQPYKTFIFDSFELNPWTKTIELRYSLDDDIKFTETIELPKDREFVLQSDSPTLKRALFPLHLIGGVSYYKTCLPKSIEVKSGNLTPDQAQFWNTVYENGLGEFFYKNNIDPHDVVHFEGTIDFPPPVEKKRDHEGKKKILVPLGGGKDSVVTAEILKSSDFSCTLFRMGGHPFIEALAKEMKLPMLTVERKLPGTLFDLNAQGALNGHVPITGYLSFLTVVLSLLYGYDAVAMSNERSANEGNVQFKGREINHQWSKSLEFERLFQSYVQTYITQDVSLFSAIRPLTELHVASLFSQMPHYFEHVTSCNANWKILGEKPASRWCGKCPKCAFSFVLFSAFLPKQTLTHMFGKDLFADASLLPLYRELLGLEGCKPFECVGTAAETKAAFFLAKERGDFAGTPVMELFEKKVHPTITSGPALMQEQLTPSDEHAIPIAYSVTLS